MTFECPVLLKLRPWYAAVDDALEELARERGDGACKSRACRTQDPAPAVCLNLQTSADVLGRLEVELGDFARRVELRVEAARAGAVDCTA